MVLVALAVGSIAAGSGAASNGHGYGHSQTLWASPTGSGTACTANAPCSLDTAVSTASPGATVRAEGGTYQTNIVITTQLDLVGQGNAVLDASTSGQVPGIQILAPGSSVSHFTVEGAYYEGILVGNSSTDGSGSPISDVTIDHVTVTGNDTGYNGNYGEGNGECFTPNPTTQNPHPAPGDCGEGIHLTSATNSIVEHSYIEGNAGGVLLTDEFGQTSNNTIEHNTVLNNTHDCGITLASHSGQGVDSNLVQHNTVDGNGTVGEGGGILMAGGPGAKVSGNTITHNEASGNGLAGVVIHLHVPGSNLNGNTITYNHLSNNNLDGDFDFSPNIDNQTTDILVASVVPLEGTTIEHNQLSDAHYGIWTLNVDPSANTIDHNQFSNITTNVSSN